MEARVHPLLCAPPIHSGNHQPKARPARASEFLSCLCLRELRPSEVLGLAYCAGQSAHPFSARPFQLRWGGGMGIGIISNLVRLETEPRQIQGLNDAYGCRGRGVQDVQSTLAIVLSPLTRAWMVYPFARAATTEDHRVGDLDMRNVFSHSSGSWTSNHGVAGTGSF